MFGGNAVSVVLPAYNEALARVETIGDFRVYVKR